MGRLRDDGGSEDTAAAGAAHILRGAFHTPGRYNNQWVKEWMNKQERLCRRWKEKSVHPRSAQLSTQWSGKNVAEWKHRVGGRNSLHSLPPRHLHPQHNAESGWRKKTPILLRQQLEVFNINCVRFPCQLIQSQSERKAKFRPFCQIQGLNQK